MKYVFLFLLSFPLNAKTLEVVNHPYDYKDVPEYKAIMEALAPYGEFGAKTKDVTPTPAPENKPMSKGQLAVEEAKARNRAIIAAQTKAEKDLRDKNDDMTELEKWKREEKETLAKWKKETADTLASWKKEQDIFLGRIKVYKENTFEIPIPKEKIVEKKVEVSRLPEVAIVNGAFMVPIRDQWSRPTCSAFAGARVVEILMAQNNVNRDLSEQYLYWASKPKCYTTPCSQKGSWIVPGYKYSQEQMNVNIPLEGTCGYLGETVAGNDTQIPLRPGCQEGSVRVVSFEQVRTLADTIEQLKKNIPVVMAAKLSPNFYKNKGLVTLTDADKPSADGMDSHSLGHAFVGVGLIELPEKLRATEGNYCIVVANSWGKGWGAGGYSCLTENWLTKYRQPSPFVTVSRVEIK